MCLGQKGLGDIRGSGLKQGCPSGPDEVVPPSVWHTGRAREGWKISIKRQIRAAWYCGFPGKFTGDTESVALQLFLFRNGKKKIFGKKMTELMFTVENLQNRRENKF